MCVMVKYTLYRIIFCVRDGEIYAIQGHYVRDGVVYAIQGHLCA